MAPRPSSTQSEFLLSTGRCTGIVERLWRVDDSKLTEQLVKRWISVAESGEFNAVSIDILHDGGLQTDLQFPQVSQLRRFQSEKLNELVGVFHRSWVDDHDDQSLRGMLRRCKSPKEKLQSYPAAAVE